MTIDKFGRDIGYKFNTNNVPLQTSTNVVWQYIDDKFDNLEGYIIEHFVVGPNIDSQTLYYKFDTGNFRYNIPINNCKIARIRPSIPFRNFRFFLNNNPTPIQNILNKNLNTSDTISIQQVQPINEPFDLFIYLKHKVI